MMKGIPFTTSSFSAQAVEAAQSDSTLLANPTFPMRLSGGRAGCRGRGPTSEVNHTPQANVTATGDSSRILWRSSTFWKTAIS